MCVAAAAKFKVSWIQTTYSLVLYNLLHITVVEVQLKTIEMLTGTEHAMDGTHCPACFCYVFTELLPSFIKHVLCMFLHLRLLSYCRSGICCCFSTHM